MIGTQDNGKLKIVWYHAEPTIYGVGPTEMDARNDLISRETGHQEIGGISISKIGKTTIVRHKGFQSLGSNVNEALKSLLDLPVGDPVVFSFDEGRWHAAESGLSATALTPGDAYKWLQKESKNTRSKYFGCQLDGDIKVVWYLAEPEIRGTGKTEQDAIEDLKGRETSHRSFGGVEVSEIGKSTIVRCGGSMGVGPTYNCAMKSMVGTNDNIGFTFNGKWVACDVDRSVAGDNPRDAYQKLLEICDSNGQAKQIVEAVNKAMTTTNPVFSTCFIPGVLGEKKPLVPRHVRIQDDGRLKVVWYANEPSVCGVGETVDLAIKDLRSRESRVARQGSVDVSSIGSVMIVRTMKGTGIGTNINEAVKDLLDVSGDHVRFEFKDGRWLAINREGFVGSSRDPYLALRRLNEISKPTRPSEAYNTSELREMNEKLRRAREAADARYEADLRGARGEIDALRQMIEKGQNEYDLLKAAYDKRLVVPAGMDVLKRAILSLGVSIHTTYRDPSREWSVTIESSTGCSRSEKAALSLAVSCWVNQSKGRLRDLISAILEVGD